MVCLERVLCYVLPGYIKSIAFGYEDEESVMGCRSLVKEII